MIPSLISSLDAVFSENATAPLIIPRPLKIKEMTQETVKIAKDRMISKKEFGPGASPPSAGNAASIKNKKAIMLPDTIMRSAFVYPFLVIIIKSSGVIYFDSGKLLISYPLGGRVA